MHSGSVCKARENTAHTNTHHKLVVDTGATKHMVCAADRQMVQHPLNPPTGTVIVANNKQVTPAGTNHASGVALDADDVERRVTMPDALVMPTFSNRLHSIPQCVTEGHRAVFGIVHGSYIEFRDPQHKPAHRIALEWVADKKKWLIELVRANSAQAACNTDDDDTDTFLAQVRAALRYSEAKDHEVCTAKEFNRFGSVEGAEVGQALNY